jgi:hypothetical protein
LPHPVPPVASVDLRLGGARLRQQRASRSFERRSHISPPIDLDGVVKVIHGVADPVAHILVGRPHDGTFQR